MFGKLGRVAALAGLSAVLLLAATRLASAINPNEHSVKPEANAQDFDDVRLPNGKLWALDFKFRPPRLIKVRVPGRGDKICWYLWYQVINRTEVPHTFIPDFELVTHDRDTIHHDQVLPHVQDAIRQLEDPTDYLKIKNSVTMAATPIPPSRKNAEPTAVTGVAIWDDVDPDSNYYSIFVSGLSNGWAVTDDPDKPGEKSVVRRKTLQLNFRRIGDRFYQKSEEIRFMPPAQWIYRGSSLTIPTLPSASEDKKP
jgi:hypothetical protein